jgi:predicted Fe-Mo cluster-binding NifX family protein
MLAIPVFRARVAPVLDWCSKIIIYPKEEADAASCRQIDVMEGNIFSLIRGLREKGTRTLICGALSPEMLHYGESIGLRIIHGIAGEIEEVLQAYREGRLNLPQYRLPGCRGGRNYKAKERCNCKRKNSTASRPKPGGAGTDPDRKLSVASRGESAEGPDCEGCNMSKIAITSEGPCLDDRVDSRFGRAAGFVVVDLESMETRYIDNGQTQVMAQGAGIQAAELVARAGVGCVLSGYVGPKAFQALSAAKIKVVQDLEEGITVRQAVERFRTGDVQFACGPNKGAGR